MIITLRAQILPPHTGQVGATPQAWMFVDATNVLAQWLSNVGGIDQEHRVGVGVGAQVQL